MNKAMNQELISAYTHRDYVAQAKTRKGIEDYAYLLEETARACVALSGNEKVLRKEQAQKDIEKLIATQIAFLAATVGNECLLLHGWACAWEMRCLSGSDRAVDGISKMTCGASPTTRRMANCMRVLVRRIDEAGGPQLRGDTNIIFATDQVSKYREHTARASREAVELNAKESPTVSNNEVHHLMSGGENLRIQAQLSLAPPAYRPYTDVPGTFYRRSEGQQIVWNDALERTMRACLAAAEKPLKNIPLAPVGFSSRSFDGEEGGQDEEDGDAPLGITCEYCHTFFAKSMSGRKCRLCSEKLPLFSEQMRKRQRVSTMFKEKQRRSVPVVRDGMVQRRERNTTTNNNNNNSNNEDTDDSDCWLGAAEERHTDVVFRPNFITSEFRIAAASDNVIRFENFTSKLLNDKRKHVFLFYFIFSLRLRQAEKPLQECFLSHQALCPLFLVPRQIDLLPSPLLRRLRRRPLHTCDTVHDTVHDAVRAAVHDADSHPRLFGFRGRAEKIRRWHTGGRRRARTGSPARGNSTH